MHRSRPDLLISFKPGMACFAGFIFEGDAEHCKKNPPFESERPLGALVKARLDRDFAVKNIRVRVAGNAKNKVLDVQLQG